VRTLAALEEVGNVWTEAKKIGDERREQGEENDKLETNIST
jgi:hypothetical protein